MGSGAATRLMGQPMNHLCKYFKKKHKKSEPLKRLAIYGEANGARTHDPRHHKPVL